MPGAVVIAPLAFFLANMLIYWSGFEVIWKLGICVVIGYVLIGISMAFDPQRPPLDWKSAQWLPFYLIGMGVISWQGQFSGAAATPPPKPPTNTGNIPFWWDILVVFGFSMIIYFWAQRTRLSRNEMLDLVNRQAGEGAPDPRVSTDRPVSALEGPTLTIRVGPSAFTAGGEAASSGAGPALQSARPAPRRTGRCPRRRRPGSPIPATSPRPRAARPA